MSSTASSKCKEYWGASPEAKGEISVLAGICVKVGLWPKGNGYHGWAKWATLTTKNLADLQIEDGRFTLISWKSYPTGSDPIHMRVVGIKMPDIDVNYLEKLFRATIESTDAQTIWQ